MTTTFSSDNVQVPARWIQIGFLAIAVLFNLCLVAQLLAVGGIPMFGLVAGSAFWE